MDVGILQNAKPVSLVKLTKLVNRDKTSGSGDIFETDVTSEIVNQVKLLDLYNILNQVMWRKELLLEPT